MPGVRSVGCETPAPVPGRTGGVPGPTFTVGTTGVVAAATVFVGVGDGVGEGVGDGVGDGVGVYVGVAVGTGVGVLVGAGVLVAVGVARLTGGRTRSVGVGEAASPPTPVAAGSTTDGARPITTVRTVD